MPLLLSYILRDVSFTEVDSICRVTLWGPMHLCTCVSEEGGDGEVERSETSSLMSYTLRDVSFAEVGIICRVELWGPMYLFCETYECPFIFDRKKFIYYESTKRKLKTKYICGCRCYERLQPKTKEFTRLSYTELVLILFLSSVLSGRKKREKRKAQKAFRWWGRIPVQA